MTLWQCHETFWYFFHESNPDKQVKNFLLKIRFRGDMREIRDSAQANTARSQTLRRLTLHGVLLAPIFSLQASPCLEREF